MEGENSTERKVNRQMPNLTKEKAKEEKPKHEIK